MRVGNGRKENDGTGGLPARQPLWRAKSKGNRQEGKRDGWKGLEGTGEGLGIGSQERMRKLTRDARGEQSLRNPGSLMPLPPKMLKLLSVVTYSHLTQANYNRP